MAPAAENADGARIEITAVAGGNVSISGIGVGLGPATPNFEALRGAFVDHYLAAPFVGRGKEIHLLNEWLEGSHKAGPSLALLTGPAGRGKSALISHWLENVRAAGHRSVFVPISSRFNTNRPEVVFPALAAGLATLLGIRLETPSTGAFDAYRDIIVSLLGKFTDPEACCVLIIDGADETLLAGWSLGPTLLPTRRIPGLRILVSARPLAGDEGSLGWLKRLGWSGPEAEVSRLEIGMLTKTEVGEFVTQITRSHDPSPSSHDLSDLIEQVYRLSEKGDALMVGLYADEVRDALKGGAEDFEAISRRLRQRNPGLQDYFLNWMGERVQVLNASSEIGRLSAHAAEAALVLLASALGPLLHGELLALLRLAQPDQDIPAKSDLLAPLARFVVGDGTRVGYTLGHPRFNVFLLEEQYTGTPLLERARVAFLDWGRGVVAHLLEKKHPAEELPSYVLNWYPWHELRLGKEGWPQLAKFLSTEWIEACRRTAGDGGFAVVGQAILDELLKSLDQPGKVNTEQLSEALRASLFMSSLREAVNFFNPRLLILAFENSVLDETAILARLSLLHPEQQARMVLDLSHSLRLDAKRAISLWREAIPLTNLTAPGRARSFALVNLHDAVRRLVRRKDFNGASFHWEDLLLLIQQWVDESPSEYFYYGRYPFSGSLDQLHFEASLPKEKEADLLRLLLGSHENPGLRAVLLKTMLKTRMTSPRSDLGAGSAEESGVAELLLSIASGQDRASRCARAILHMLTSYGEAPGNLHVILDKALGWASDNKERINVAAALVSVASLHQDSAPLIHELIRRAGNEFGPTNFAILAVVVVPGFETSLTKTVAVRAWRATSRVTETSWRITLRTLLLPHLPEGTNVKDALQMEILLQSNYPDQFIGDLDRLLRVASARLALEDRSSLENDLTKLPPPYPELLRAALENGTHARKQTNDESLVQEVQTLLKSLNNRKELSTFNQALDLTKRVQSRRIKSDLLSQLVNFAPDPKKSDLIREALADAGAIEDRDVASEAIVRLAVFLPADIVAVEANTALSLLDGVDPIHVVYSICNVAPQLPKPLAAIWAARARAAIDHLQHDPAKAGRAMGRILNRLSEFAPLSYVSRSLEIAADGGKWAADVYWDLINIRDWRWWLAAREAWRLRTRLPNELLMGVECSLVGRSFFLFWWLVEPALKRGRDVSDLYLVLRDYLRLATALKGNRRQRIIAQAIDLLEVRLKEPMKLYDSRCSQYYPIRGLYELADAVARERIIATITKCQPDEVQLQWKINLYPGLPPTERVKLEDNLLSQIKQNWRTGSVPLRAVSEGVFVLASNVAGHKNSSLIAGLQIGAHDSRRTWLYNFPRIVAALPEPQRIAVIPPLLQAIKDALRLWP